MRNERGRDRSGRGDLPRLARQRGDIPRRPRLLQEHQPGEGAHAWLRPDAGALCGRCRTGRGRHTIPGSALIKGSAAFL